MNWHSIKSVALVALLWCAAVFSASAHLPTNERLKHYGDEELAKVEGDSAFAAQAHKLYKTGLEAMNQYLWNGEFYSMAADQNFKQNDLCFVEGIYGDSLGRFVGLGSILPDDKSLSDLRAIAKYNNEATPWGLVVSANKSGQMVEYCGDRRAQITICHAIPAPIALIQEGQPDDVKTGLHILHQLYAIGQKHTGGLWDLPHYVIAATGEQNLDDFEHYLRDRALWALLKVLNGWSYNAPEQSLAIGPILLRGA